MSGFFTFLFILSLICLVIGLAKPRAFNKLLKQRSDRRHAAVIFGGLTFALLIAVAVTTPPQQRNLNATATKSISSKPITPVKISVQPKTTAPTLASLNSQAKAIFLPVTQSYITLYNQGNADAALSDPSTYLKWSDSFVKTNDPRLDASLTAYNSTAALYKTANQKQPSALKSWFDDNEDVYTDISAWSSDEESDLGSSTVSSSVTSDIQTYNKDLTATQNDLNALVSGTSLPLASMPTTTAATSTTSSSSQSSCYPTANSGNCYEPGEYCSNADHGMSGIAGDGKSITCEDNDGWRWEP